MRRFTYQNTFKKDRQVCITRSEWDHPIEAELHSHEFMELVYVAKGTGHHRIDGERYDVTKGSLLLINYEQTHAFQMEADYQFYNILMKPDFLAEQLVNIGNAFEILSLTAFADFQSLVNDRVQMVKFLGPEVLLMDDVVNALYTEYAGDLVGRTTMMKSYITLLLTWVFRKMSVGLSQNSMNSERIPAEILDYLEKHYQEKISLNELAKKCLYQPAYFSTVFKECYGITLTEYLQRKRIEHGCRLLRETDLSVEEIGRQVGYEDNVRFYRYFKKICGMTPNVYRNQEIKK